MGFGEVQVFCLLLYWIDNASTLCGNLNLYFPMGSVFSVNWTATFTKDRLISAIRTTYFSRMASLSSGISIDI